MEWSLDWGEIGLCNLVKYSPMRRLTILARPNRFKRTRRRLCRMSVYLAVSLYMHMCVYVWMSMSLSKCCFIACGWLGRGRSYCACSRQARQMDTHTSIIIINSMKGNSDSNGDGGNLLALTVCSAVFHEVCNIFYACAAGGDCETTAIKKRRNYN